MEQLLLKMDDKSDVKVIAASSYLEASTYTLTWDASNASSGVYFVQANAAGFTKTQKLMLVK